MTTSSILMPAVFIGHGSPMLALQSTPITQAWRQCAESMPKPDAILCISAHWESSQTADNPSLPNDLIYDFYGFPEPLYQVAYTASSAPQLSEKLGHLLPNLIHQPQRGLDHGTWCVLKHMYPEADIPVLQLSLNRNLTPREHIELAKQLQPLRQQNILILGSGNLIHNLRLLDPTRMDKPFDAYAWAADAQTQLLKLIIDNDLTGLANYHELGESVRLAIPTPEHFLPLLYVLAQRHEDEPINIFNQVFSGASLDMTCVQVGLSN